MSILSFGLGKSSDNNYDPQASPGIVRDGLMLHLDPASIKSYNTNISTTRWNDISGNLRYVTFANYGTETSVPTYSSTEGGGSFLYNGTSHYAFSPSTAFAGHGFFASLGLSAVSMVSDGSKFVVVTITASTTSRRIVTIGATYRIASSTSTQFNTDYTVTNVVDNGTQLVITLETITGGTVTSATVLSGFGTHNVYDNDFTLEWWFKPAKQDGTNTYATSSPYYQQIIGWRLGSSVEIYFLFRDAEGTTGTTDVTTEPRFAGTDSTGTWLNSYWNTWKHMVFTCYKGTQKLYINNIETGAGSFRTSGIGSSTATPTTVGTFYVGHSQNAWLYKGYMGTVRYYARGFSGSDVSINFNATKSRYGVS